MPQAENVIRLFGEPARGKGCCVYVVGHPHPKHGHALKVGIANQPSLRIGNLQVGNPELISTYAIFRFERLALAQEVEFRFHDSGLCEPIHGEWVKGNPEEVITYLGFLITNILQSAYPNPPDRKRVRRASGLVASFDLVNGKLSDEQENRINERFWDYEVQRAGGLLV